jgi:hypothetical protein
MGVSFVSVFIDISGERSEAMIGGRLRLATLGGALLVAVLAVLIVSQVDGRPAVARTAASQNAVSLHRIADARVAGRLKAHAAQIVRSLDAQRHSAKGRLPRSKTKTLVHVRHRSASAVRGCIRGSQKQLTPKRRTGKGGQALPGPGFASAAQIERLVRSCLGDASSAQGRASRAVSAKGA